VRRGADLLVNLTNDFWFGQSPALRQHLHLAVFRAVENKRYLLRSTTTGATAVIAPTGKIIEQAPFGDPHALLATVHTADLTTFYTQWGNVFAWACCAAVVIVSVRHYLARRSQAKP
jgi:apolipoprotein N-acyltransferase